MSIWNKIKTWWAGEEKKFHQLSVHDFTPETHTAYYEYFADATGAWFIRIYDYATSLVVEQAKGKSPDHATARKDAQNMVRKLMVKYEKIKEGI